MKMKHTMAPWPGVPLLAGALLLAAAVACGPSPPSVDAGPREPVTDSDVTLHPLHFALASGAYSVVTALVVAPPQYDGWRLTPDVMDVVASPPGAASGPLRVRQVLPLDGMGRVSLVALSLPAIQPPWRLEELALVVRSVRAEDPATGRVASIPGRWKLVVFRDPARGGFRGRLEAGTLGGASYHGVVVTGTGEGDAAVRYHIRQGDVARESLVTIGPAGQVQRVKG